MIAVCFKEHLGKTFLLQARADEYIGSSIHCRSCRYILNSVVPVNLYCRRYSYRNHSIFIDLIYTYIHSLVLLFS